MNKNLESLTVKELEKIAGDFQHPQRDEAAELLHAYYVERSSRYTQGGLEY